MKTIYWDNTGPLMKYDGASLHIEDLNPHIKTSWSMSRWHMIKLGFSCILVAIVAKDQV